jgi:uncharacterized protein YydD (DUF2326 family)
MFLNLLSISSKEGRIRNIKFRKGINLIVDETIKINETTSGNDVGKTTVLKLIDFCFGAKPEIIYTHPENKKEDYDLVKKYLENEEVLITLILSENLDNDNSEQIIIERNFLSRSKAIRKINHQDILDKDFEDELSKAIFPEHYSIKPTLRQIISHNIRYKDESLNNTLKMLDKYTSDSEYETLYLFLFGCEFDGGNEKQELNLKLQQELTFKHRLEKKQSKSAYETTLALIKNEIEQLNTKKNTLNINENFEKDLATLNDTKYHINKVSSEISKLKIRKDLIQEAQEELAENNSKIDFEQLKSIYEQASNKIEGLQKTFEDLVNYHNKMIEEKIRFITKELPELEENISNKDFILKNLLKKEKELSILISKSNSFEELENIIINLNKKYSQKGEYDSIILQISEVEKNIDSYSDTLKKIEDNLFSNTFENSIQKQIDKFNIFFASISDKLYGEKYAIKRDVIIHKKTKQKIYKFTTFSPFNPNISSGKKQGEIASFDIAYILFADSENIPCLHFILNDKKELMHGNQLVKIAQIASEYNVQFVASILKDKLPEELNNDNYFILKLSQEDKLFRIEEG